MTDQGPAHPIFDWQIGLEESRQGAQQHGTTTSPTNVVNAMTGRVTGPPGSPQGELGRN
jgi:hypothetical protein